MKRSVITHTSSKSASLRALQLVRLALLKLLSHYFEGAVCLIVLFMSIPANAQSSDWSTPVNLGPNINSASREIQVSITHQGLSLYFSSNRPGGFGQQDIYVSRRTSLNAPWGPAKNLGPTINSPNSDYPPNFSPDDHWMFFGSDRPGGFGGLDIWVSYRADINDDFGWEAPMNFGPSVNTSADEGDAFYFVDPATGKATLYFTSLNRPGAPGDWDIYQSTQNEDGSFNPAVLVPELSTPFRDTRMAIRYDGLEIIFSSDRPGGLGDVDLWFSTRQSTADVWSKPVNLGPVVNSSARDAAPYLSADGKTLFFSSTRVGGFGDVDLWVTTRTQLPLLVEGLASGVFYFAQAGGGSGSSTEINLRNPSTTKSVTGAISFFGTDGRPLDAVVENPVVPFVVPASGSVTIRTNSQGPVRSGYARISSSDPLIASATYLLPGFTPGTVSPSMPNAFSFRSPVARDIALGTEAGVSVVNVSDTTVRVVLSVVDSSGRLLPSGRTAVVLAPGEQLSRFLGELFPGMSGKFAGILRVTALSPFPSQAVVVTVVQIRPSLLNVVPLTLLDKLAPLEEETLQ